MNITPAQTETIVSTARLHIGRELPRFKCLKLVRDIFNEVGITIPPISPNHPPPQELNITENELLNLPVGHLIFLKSKTGISPRPWTHVAVIVSRCAVVHRSRYFGETVVLSTLDEVFQFYNFAKS